jgi:undecaprenyl-diphosphatase
VARSPSDILRLAVAVVLLLALLIVQWLAGDTLITFVNDLLSGLDAIPTWILDVFVALTRLGAVVGLLVGLVVTLRHGRQRELLTVALAAAIAIVLTLLFDTFSPDSGTPVIELDDVFGPLTSQGFPSAAGVAAASAVVTAAAPWVERRWRRLGWVLVFGLAITHFLASAISFDSVRALLVGWLGGAAALVILGGPLRRPTGLAIAEGLASVGVPLQRLERASVDARGSTPYFGVAADGQKLFIKALGQDQRSADLLFRVYRWAQRKDLGDERPFSSLRRGVEHEAMVALAARDAGILTPRLVGFATAEPNAYVLAYEAIEGRSLDRVGADEMTDGVLESTWALVAQQRRHRIAHRDLRLANIFLAADGQVWMIDYGFSELAASDLLLATDVAELLASSSAQVGAERAVAAARRVVGPEVVATSLDRLRPWALGGATRTALAEQPGSLDALRQQVVAATT